MNLLYLSHCVPMPPDKGERIRACHQLRRLAEHHQIHLACFARSREEAAHEDALRRICASVYVEPIPRPLALAKAGLRFAAGGCLSTAFYSSAGMRRHLRSLAGSRTLDAAVVFSSAIAPLAPPDLPFLFDMVDVDSEKWLEYGRRRPLGPLYTREGKRLRRVEIEFTRRAAATFLSTRREIAMFRSFAPAESVCRMENGVDTEYFDPGAVAPPAALRGRRILVFVGAMDYYPNRDAACWFAETIYPELRRRDAALEFFVVGRDPGAAVQKLRRIPGVSVTGTVADVRPYLAAAAAAVAPLRIARGIQNKVLEALAMGKPVLASTAVCSTFETPLPSGMVACDSPGAYWTAVSGLAARGYDPRIRDAAGSRFSWDRNLGLLEAALRQLRERRVPASA